jgi:hypothetical protein
LSNSSAVVLDVKARYIRTPAKGTYGTAFYRAALLPLEVDQLCAVDIDGDGDEEVAIATESGELVLLDAKGALRWRRDLDNPITDLYPFDLDADGVNELLVSDNGWYIRGFDADGNLKLNLDCKKVGLLLGPYALGSVTPVDSTRPLITVATGYGAVCLTPTGQMVCEIIGGGVTCDTVLRGHTSSKRASHRTASKNSWSHGGWREIYADPKQAEGKSISGSLGGFWWLSHGLEFWPETGAPRDPSWRDGMAVLVARAGIAAYSLGDEKPAVKWRINASGPISAYTFADIDGRPGSELVITRLDGSIHIIDRQGKMQQTWETDGPVYDVSPCSARGAALALATEHELRFVDRSGRIQAAILNPVRKLAVVKTRSGNVLVAATNDGRVIAIADDPS